MQIFRFFNPAKARSGLFTAERIETEKIRGKTRKRNVNGSIVGAPRSCTFRFLCRESQQLCR